MVGGGGEQRTLRIAAKHADLTHWFALGLEGLAHKRDLLRRYCEDIGRDPATIELTMGGPVIVAETEAEARAMWELIPEERRATVAYGGPDRAAESLRPYVEAGFTGFTFNNSLYRSIEQIALLGQVLRDLTS